MVLVGEIEVLGENLLRRHFVHHKSHLPDPGANPGRRSGKPATNRFRYGAASFEYVYIFIKVYRSMPLTPSVDSIFPNALCPLLPAWRSIFLLVFLVTFPPSLFVTEWLIHGHSIGVGRLHSIMFRLAD
jgi:hypothetical protein